MLWKGKLAAGNKFPLYSYTCFGKGVRFQTESEHEQMKYMTRSKGKIAKKKKKKRTWKRSNMW